MWRFIKVVSHGDRSAELAELAARRWTGGQPEAFGKQLVDDFSERSTGFERYTARFFVNLVVNRYSCAHMRIISSPSDMKFRTAPRGAPGDADCGLHELSAFTAVNDAR